MKVKHCGTDATAQVNLVFHPSGVDKLNTGLPDWGSPMSSGR